MFGSLRRSMKRKALHEVRDHGTEHGHVQQRTDYLAGERGLALPEVDDQRET